MSNNVFCGNCGEPITDEAPDLEVAQRKPCPKCGSTSRTYGVEATATASASATVNATDITYPQKLLTLTRRLIDDGEFAVAIVVAHMACEVATERSFTDAFANKGIPFLEEPLSEFINGYNLNHEKIRKLYTALTGDDVAKAPFWEKFKASATRRNKIIHASATATNAEAEESYQAAMALVSHLKK